MRDQLFTAVEAGDAAVAARLLEDGADVNGRNVVGETPLITASHEGYTEVARLLLDWGAETEARDDDGNTALLAAVGGGHAGTLRLLLSRGASPNVISKARFTPLVLSLIYDGRMPLLALLLEHGADPDLRQEDMTPLMWAMHNGEAVGLLIRYGADVNAKDQHGKTVLRQALEDCGHDAIPLLKAAGAKA